MTFGPGCKMEENFGPEWWRERTQEGRISLQREIWLCSLKSRGYREAGWSPLRENFDHSNREQ